MQEILKLHCGIENCNEHYNYEQYDKSIVAISAQWRNLESKSEHWSGLLQKQPIIGGTYELQINFALQIDLSQNFWAAYFEPYTEIEGIDSEIGIKSMTFCLCKNKNIVIKERRFAKIVVEVINLKKITDDNIAVEEINKRSKFLDTEVSSTYVSIENFQDFSFISANYQGNCGWTYIIERKNQISRIVAENHWDLHRNIWLSTNENLDKEQEKKYGIQH